MNSLENVMTPSGLVTQAKKEHWPYLKQDTTGQGWKMMWETMLELVLYANKTRWSIRSKGVRGMGQWLEIGIASDCWGGNLSLVARIPRDASVDSLIKNHTWALPAPTSHEALEFHYEILKVELPQGDIDDRIVWKPNPSGCFTFTSAWEVTRVKHPKVNWYKIVWSNWVPQKQYTILWFAVLNGLKTRCFLSRISPNIMVNCVLCGTEPETCEHLFFQCQYSKQIWTKLLLFL